MTAPSSEQKRGAVPAGAAPFGDHGPPEAEGPRFTLRRALLVDPPTGQEAPGSVCVSQGLIKWLGPPEAEPEGEVFDLPGLVVCPGLLDLHTHLRVPGQEYKEDLVSGTSAAVAGGFTAVCAMPNTTPALDRPARILPLQQRVQCEARCRVYLAGAATEDNEGEQLTDFAALREAGCVAVSDDAFPLPEIPLMAEALRAAEAVDLPFLAHLEKHSRSRGGPITAGPLAEELGIAGQDPAAESQALMQWAEAAEGVGRLHLLHLNTADGVQLLRHLRAGSWSTRLTGETAPHYLLLTTEAVRRWGSAAKMNPPLREERDRQALLEALRHGTIEVIATDHAPHSVEEKAAGLAEAPFGIVGLETCVGLVLTHLVNTGMLTLRQALAKLSIHPARILGVPGGSLEPGQPADLTILDLHKSWTVDPDQFYSKGRATPFAGERLVGKPWGTIVAGHWAMQEGQVLARN